MMKLYKYKEYKDKQRIQRQTKKQMNKELDYDTQRFNNKIYARST